MPRTSEKAEAHKAFVQTLQLMLDEDNEKSRVGLNEEALRHAERAAALRHALNVIDQSVNCVDGEHEHSRSWLCHPSQELLVLADTLGVHIGPRF